MKRKNQRVTLAMASAVLCGLAGGRAAIAANISWSGGSGAWDTPASWPGATGAGGLPGPSDNATLGNVASGTRTVTVDATTAETVNGLTFIQTDDAVNQLVVESGVTLSAKTFGNSANATAGVGSVVLQLDGTLEITSGNTAYVPNMANTVNLNNGGRIALTGLTNPTLTASGLVTVTAGTGGVATIAKAREGTGTVSFHLLSGASLHVATGSLLITSPVLSNGPSAAFDAAAGSSTMIAAGATLGVLPPVTSESHSGNKTVTVSNAGMLTHAGTLAVRTSGSSAPAGIITNSGTWQVSGGGARVEQWFGAAAPPIVSFTNAAGGTLTGSGMLTFDNQESAAVIPMTNAGTIDPGAAGIGSLTIAGSNFAFGAGSGRLKIEAAGANDHDTLELSGTLSLNGTGDTLDLALVEDFTPANGTFTLEGIVAYASMSGSFESFLVNGQATTWSMQFVDHGGSGDLVVTVPEPGSLGVFVPALLCLRRRRRTRN